MKKILIICAVALSLVSCTIQNSYTLRSVEPYDHDQMTTITTPANWHRNEVVEINGHAWQVMFAN